MITVSGTVKRSGIAIAVAAIVDAHSGINSVSPDLLQEGIHALVKGTSPKDFPEAIIACDNLAVGISIKLPGIRTIAVVAQSAMDSPELDPEVPCIIGVPNLLNSISQGDIIIVDGCKNVIYIDPDPQTLIAYQQIEDQHASRSRFFIGSEHIPAQTQTGETVYCYAFATNLEDIIQAIDAGADGLMIDMRNAEAVENSFYKDVFFTAAGKPVAFAVNDPPVDIIDSAKQFSSPGQVKILFQHSRFNELIDSIEPLLEEMMIDAQENPDAPAIGIGVISDCDTFSGTDHGYYAAIDLQGCKLQGEEVAGLSDFMTRWIVEKDAQDVILVIGDHIETMKIIVNAGVRCIAVNPDMIADAKYAIREIGLEYTEE